MPRQPGSKPGAVVFGDEEGQSGVEEPGRPRSGERSCVDEGRGGELRTGPGADDELGGDAFVGEVGDEAVDCGQGNRNRDGPTRFDRVLDVGPSELVRNFA